MLCVFVFRIRADPTASITFSKTDTSVCAAEVIAPSSVGCIEGAAKRDAPAELVIVLIEIIAATPWPLAYYPHGSVPFRFGSMGTGGSKI